VGQVGRLALNLALELSIHKVHTTLTEVKPCEHIVVAKVYQKVCQGITNAYHSFYLHSVFLSFYLA
jgi:long-subunit acyl-CoA synthetase (AMP-forming)